MKTKPTVGQTIYSLNVGNAARHCEQELTPVIVTKVGRKYFTTCKDGYRYHLEGWSEATDYSVDNCLYESIEEYEEEKVTNQLKAKVSDFFSGYRSPDLPKEDLEVIVEIIRRYKLTRS